MGTAVAEKRRGEIESQDITMTPNQIAEAYRASVSEHKMELWTAIKTHKKAVFWSAIMGLTIIMESYDQILIGSFYALPAFQKQFGFKTSDGTYQVSAPWQSALSLAQNVGLIIGIFANTILVDRWGNIILILLGFPLGTINTIAPAYCIEIVPLALRHYGPTYINLCWVFGHILGSGILRIYATNETQWAWRIPYAVQWIWPVRLLICVGLTKIIRTPRYLDDILTETARIQLIYAPESPWFLVRQHRHEEALDSLNRLSAGVDNRETLSLIQHTVDLERRLEFGTSVWDCFRGSDLRRTEIACITWSSQIWTQFALASGTYFFEVAGLPTNDAFDLGIGQYAMAGVATILSMGLLERVGRRTLWLAGLGGMLVPVLCIGVLSPVPNQTAGIVWSQGILVLVRFFAYGISCGPIPFVYCAEISSVKLRQKTLALSRNTFNLVNLISSCVSPYLVNPTAANLKGKTAWISVGLTILIAIWSYFRFPETRARSFEELDILFASHVPA
ncbi:and other transporter-domain-containing protein [Coniella lustricola]|uniref:And other transporter-domain-containing protein n=1 Tax=Coniella lustricola TaxID=2025994 RepID=A0A2T3A460_9PEZI|nr:and other transporter-domain-containing protein [Coniella lustricola]